MATNFKTGNINQQYEQYICYERHQSRLKQIMMEKMKTETETDVLKSKIIIYNKMRLNEFIESEKIKYIEKENRILLDKLQEIAKGKHIAVAKHNNRNSPRSLNYFKMKKQAEKIDEENKHLLHRITSQGSALDKRILAMDFAKTNKYRSNIQKSNKTSIEKVLKKQRWYLGDPAHENTRYLPPIKRNQALNLSKSQSTSPIRVSGKKPQKVSDILLIFSDKFPPFNLLCGGFQAYDNDQLNEQGNNC